MIPNEFSSVSVGAGLTCACITWSKNLEMLKAQNHQQVEDFKYITVVQSWFSAQWGFQMLLMASAHKYFEPMKPVSQV